MTPQQAQAYHLYFDGGKTQKEIAIEIGVTEKTMYNWVRHFSWHKMREATLAVPALIADNICKQVIAFQQSIAARPEGEQFPSPQEINMQCKLINCLDKMKKYPSKGQTIQAVNNFLHFIGDTDGELSRSLSDKFEQYMQQKATDGHQPWNIGYGPDPFVYAPPVENSSEEINIDVAATPHSNKPSFRDGTTGSGRHISGSFPPPEKTGNKPETEKPAITQQDYNDYRHLIGNTGKTTGKGTVKFRGRFVNALWLQYNLYQYTLPVTERHFINDARTVIEKIDPASLREKISCFELEKQGIAA